MKKTSKRFLILATLPMLLGGLAGCGQSSDSSIKDSSSPSSSVASSSSASSVAPLPEKYSLMKNWAGNLEEQYFTTNCTDAKTTLTYTNVPAGDSNNWVYVSRSFAYDDNVKNFSEYKTLHFEGKLATTAGTNNVMVKIQTSGANIEKVFNFPSTDGIYELSIASVDWATVQSILFFPNRTNDASTGAGSGVFNFTDISLRKTEVNADYNIDKNAPTTVQEVNTYTTGDTFKVTKDWRDSGAGVITPKVSNDVWTLDYDKTKATAGTDTSWVWAKALVTGEGLSAFKKVVFTFVGTKDHSAIFALEGLNAGGEKKKTEHDAVTFTGAEQTVELDIQHLKDGTAVSFDFSQKQMLMIHPDGGSTTAIGSIVLKSVVFSKEDITKDTSNLNIYDGSSTTFSITKGYTAFDSGTYTFDYKEGGAVEVSYNVSDYKFFKVNSIGANLKNLKTVKVSVKGEAGKTLIFKPFDSHEFQIALTGETQVVEFDISSYVYNKTWTAEQEVSTLFCYKDMAVSGATSYSGTFTINSVVYSTSGNNVYASGDVFNITNSWVDSGDKVYTVTPGSALGAFDVAYAKGESEWGTLKANLANLPDDYTKLTLKVKGTQDEKIMVKGSSGPEKTITFTGEEDTVEVSLNAGATFVGIIAAPGNKNVSGSFQIISASLVAYVDPNVNYYVAGNDTLDLNVGWANADNKYTATGTLPAIAVTYNKGTGDEWVGISTSFAKADPAVLDMVQIDITGATEGHEFLAKVEGGTEVRSTADATGKLTLKFPNTVKAGKVTIMAQDGTASVSGTFNIVAAKLYSSASEAVNTYKSGARLDMAKGWANADKKYTAVTGADGKITVTYNKGVGDEWSGISSSFAGVSSKVLDRIHLKVSGAAEGDEYLFKAEGKNDNRAVANAEGIVTFDFANPLTDVTEGKLTIMAKDGTASVSGTFVIEECYLYDSSVNTYTSGETFTINPSSYKENDASTYAFTANADQTTSVVCNNDSWKFFYTQVQGTDILKFTTLTIKAKGEAGKTLKVKPFDKFEKDLSFTGTEEQTLTVDLTEKATDLATLDLSKPVKMIFFYLDTANMGGTAVTNASFTIDSIVFSK